jgi:uncharacterized protein (TIGR00730 family)
MKDNASILKAYKNLDFLNSRDARTLRILSEYLEPLCRLNIQKVRSKVLFLGSSMVNPEHKDSPLVKYYWEAEELAFQLAKWAIKLKPKGKNFVITTGGGPGIMEAANRGAARAGGKTIGMNISLPGMEQALNSYVSPELAFIFHYFFMRKFWLLYKAKAVIAFPGGYGTLDEIFEVLTLIQTKKKRQDHFVVLLYGEEYWKKIVDFDSLVGHGSIHPEDLKLFVYCSTPEETFIYLKKRLTEFL